MDLSNFLQTVGAMADAAVIREVVKKTLRDPSVSPSDLVQALAKTLNPGGSAVVVERASSADAAAAGKVVAFLVEQGEIRIEGRRVFATSKL